MPYVSVARSMIARSRLRIDERRVSWNDLFSTFGIDVAEAKTMRAETAIADNSITVSHHAMRCEIP